MDYILKIGESFSGINFDWDKAQIEEKFGKPSDVWEDKTEMEENAILSTVEYTYEDEAVSFIFEHFNNNFLGLSIYPDKAFLDDKNLFELTKNEIFELVSNHSEITAEEAHEPILDAEIIDGEDEELANTEQYSFDDIGLTFWFDGDALVDLCISAPYTEEDILDEE